MQKNLIFKPKARLLLQLGDQLIRNEGIAMLELLKNAYDADATKVVVKFEKLTDQNSGSIEITDNGTGMDMNIIEKSWLEPGTSFKLEDKNRITNNFKRRVLGDKGIGRFAVHKLGNYIELTTRLQGSKEIHLEIDWSIFDSDEYMDEVPITITEREPEVFTHNDHGTKIIIKKLRTEWNRIKFRESYAAWNSLISPFDFKASFDIQFEIDEKDWVKNLMTAQDVIEHSLFTFYAELNKDKIIKFHYKFHPWNTMDKLSGRELSHDDKDIKSLTSLVAKDDENKNVQLVLPEDLKNIKITGHVFDRDPKVLSLGVDDKRGFKEYLDNNGGVRVYREGLRVFDYGEKGNDWLSLDLKRINLPGERLSNNILLAAISLDKNNSEGLVEKTNREGFIENKQYFAFVNAILYVLELIQILRKPDKERLRTVYGPSAKTEPVIAGIDELKKTIKSKIKNKKAQETVLNSIDRIEKNYRQFSETLLKSAGAGLTFSLVVHQAQKIVSELNATIKIEPVSEKMQKLLLNLSKIVEGFLFLVKKTSIKANSLEKIADVALGDIEIRFQVHKIELIKEYKNFSKKNLVSCADNMTIASIINILDNSIYWLDKSGNKKKKIFLSISKELKGYTSLIIADNGTGFIHPVELLTRPFFTGKPFGTGLGLYLSDEVMKSQKGLMLFPDWGEFVLPKEFKKGATVVLAFKETRKK